MGISELEVNRAFLDSIDPKDGMTLFTDDTTESRQVQDHMSANNMSFTNLHREGDVEDRPKLIHRDGDIEKRVVGKPAISAFLNS